jgi:RimJ/RimL family protein N-acetyltransferase
MTIGPILETPRLRLEPFDMTHLDGLQAMNSDPEVMRHLGGVESRERTIEVIDMVRARWERYGFGWWSWLERTTGTLVGAGCIQHLARDPANPLEIGWRLKAHCWRQGLASEAARRMAAFAFDDLAQPLLIAVAAPENLPSRRVMERLGMRYRGLEPWWGHPAMATYEITETEWRSRPADP